MDRLSRWLLNNQWVRWFAAVAAGVAAFVYWEGVLEVHVRVAATLPGALISLAGFAMAGAAILVAMRDHGQLRRISTQLPDAWNDILSQFFKAARYSLAASAYFLLSSDLSGLTATWLLRSIAVVSTLSLGLVLVQALLAVLTLESASRQGASPGPPATASSTESQYHWNGPTGIVKPQPDAPERNEGQRTDT